MNELNQKVVDEMIKVQKLVKNLFTFEIKNSFLTPTQFHALLFIKDKRNTQMKDISEHFSVTMATATSLIDKLIKPGLVIRQNYSKDRRIVRITLTKLGDKFLKEAVKQRIVKSNKLFSPLTFEEKNHLLLLLKKLPN